MSSQHTVTEFEELIPLVLSKTHLHDQDRIELEMELKQHLYDHYCELIKSGMSHDESVKEVVAQFGELKIIQKKINQNYPSTLGEYILKEIIIGLILILAIIIGPSLLVHQYRLNSLLEVLPIPFLTLLISIPFQLIVLKRPKTWKIPLVATSMIYLGFMVASFSGSGLTLDAIVQQIFILNPSNFINGNSGVFTLQTIHLIWILILLLQFIKVDSRTKVWQKMIHASFQYWGMIGLGIIIANNLPINSESAVVFINIFFITSILEHVLVDRVIVLFYHQFVKHLNSGL